MFLALWRYTTITFSSARGADYIVPAPIDDPKRTVLAKSRLNVSALRTGAVEYAGADGSRVGMRFGESLEEFRVFRNGKPYDWEAHRVLYRDVNAPRGRGIISRDWMGSGKPK